METNALNERRRFVRLYRSGLWSMTELCERLAISRPTGYKWVARWQAEGEAGLTARSSAPQAPAQTDAALVALVVAARAQYRWGATKLLHVLRRQYPSHAWPTGSTINAILDRHGLLRKQRRVRRWPHAGAAALETTAPNEVWPADFKGQFKTGDGVSCYPLTVTDHCSRAVLLCRGLPSTHGAAVRSAFETLFRAVGLPDAIRTDNGAPFASTGVHGLTPLNVWWMQLGIVHQRIRPGYPQGNGTHERMHRELKRETAVPAAATARGQQRRFDAFRRRYNEERPHEALGHRCPAAVWQPSSRAYPARVPPPAYPARWEVRRIRASGSLTFRGHDLFVSHALQGLDVGLDEVADGIWNIVFYRTVVGRLDARAGHIITG